MISIFSEPQRAILASDSRQYLGLAAILASHGVFSQTPPPPLQPEVLRTPGYPAFIAPFMLLWGPQPLKALVAAQAIIGALTAVGVALLGRWLFDERTGSLAGVTYALAPMSAVMTGYVYAETLFAACLVGGAVLLVRGLEDERWWLSAAGGVLFGMATLTRPIGLLLLPLLILIPLTRVPLRSAWRYALALIASFMLVVGAWMGRNAFYFGHFGLTTISNLNLYYYNAASLEAHRLGISLEEARAMLAERLSEQPPDDSRWPGSREGALARSIILEHPVAFAWYNGLDALNGLRPGFSFMLGLLDESGGTRDPISAFIAGDIPAILTAMRGQRVVILLLEGYMLLFTGLLVGLSVAGSLMLLLRRRWSEVVLLALIPALLLYLPGIASNARFRAPVETFLAILAAAGATGLLAMLSRSRRAGEAD